MLCNVCETEKEPSDFYANDRTCKECRKAKVRANRKANIEYYREYDRARANNPDRVASRKEYAKTEKGLAAGKRAKQAWTERNQKKRWANESVNNALRDGKLKKPDSCEFCGKKGRIEGHHADYNRPLDVEWLCSKCHREWHKEHGEGANAL